MSGQSSHNVVAMKRSRNWIYAKKPSGKLYNYRQCVGYTLLAFLLSAPFIYINGNPLMMFNIIERKFSIFGTLFYPQDLHIFVFGMLIILIFIVLFTSMFGRVWCGWTCPQTIFMELIFRRIEYLIEGDWKQQQKLDASPDSDSKAIKKIVKHTLFFMISLAISNIFLSYIIGAHALWNIISSPIETHIVGFISILVFSLVFYAVFAFGREIVCTTICPYGRLQGVMLDKDSLTIAYNPLRGEPRGKRSRNTPDGKAQGDCIDCKICVQVCPTGIDIRNGIQLECVNCTACIDACDAVMEKIHKPKRLIGFYSLGEFEENASTTPKKNQKRKFFYAAVLLVLIGLFSVMLLRRSPIDGTLLRAAGTSYQMLENEQVGNLYTIELMNKSGKSVAFYLVSSDPSTRLQMVNHIDHLAKDGKAQLSFFLIKKTASVKTYKSKVSVDIVSNGEVLKTLKTTFVAPPSA